MATVATSTGPIDEKATGWTFNHHMVFAAGLNWAFYSDGSDFVYKTSADGGSTWSDPTVIYAGMSYARSCDIFYDEKNAFLHVVASGEAATYKYRRGTPNSDGTITWSAAWQDCGDGTTPRFVSISVDSEGHAWIGYMDGSTTTPYVNKNANTDGTWAAAAGFPAQLKNAPYIYWAAIPVPLSSNGDMMIIYVRAFTGVYARKYTVAGGLGAETEINDSGIVPSGLSLTAVADGEDNVHVVWHRHTLFSYPAVHVKYTAATSTWSSEEKIADQVQAMQDLGVEQLGALSIDRDSNVLYFFWKQYNQILLYLNAQGVWDSSPIIFADDETLSDTTGLPTTTICSWKKEGVYINVMWSTGLASPFNVRWATRVELPASLKAATHSI